MPFSARARGPFTRYNVSSMAYVSLYRKYRPQTFDEVVGQEHVTTTLANAIATGRVGSAYLFTGTRGTAKTTCARILAKALNCVGPDGSLTAPSPVPCSVCPPCRGIASSSFVDVLEMDAASHGKVDDVRDLVASIKFPPMEGRYKVYIIDEAHQLSRDAMDAFLKTLEEPPDRVVFVLATTELDKLPVTIASRCQVFEFKRGSVAAISSRLNGVLAAEGVAADPDAVTLVARAADGSYRDSLSLLEQVLAYKPNDITPMDVSRVLGTVDDDLLSDVVARIAEADMAGAFTVADAITSSGKDVRQFIRTLSARMRDMLFLSVGAHGDAEISVAARSQAGLIPSGILLRALEILAETERDMRWANQHRLVLELTLLRLCGLAEGREDVASLPVHEKVHRPAVATATASADRNKATAPAPAITGKETVQTPIGAESLPTRPDHDDTASLSPSLTRPPKVDMRDTDPRPAIASSTDNEEIHAGPVETFRLPEPSGHGDLLRVQQVAHVSPPARAANAKPALPADAPADLVRLQKSWQEVVNRMGSRSPSGASMIQDATPIRLEGTLITLQFQSAFHVDRLDSNVRGRKAIEDIINRTLGLEPDTYHIKCVRASSAPEPAPPAAAIRQSGLPPAAAPHEEPGQLLETVIAVFGGAVIDD
jgi:DNA polymerase-3 subunit gamma/tau